MQKSNTFKNWFLIDYFFFFSFLVDGKKKREPTNSYCPSFHVLFHWFIRVFELVKILVICNHSKKRSPILDSLLKLWHIHREREREIAERSPRNLRNHPTFCFSHKMNHLTNLAKLFIFAQTMSAISLQCILSLSALNRIILEGNIKLDNPKRRKAFTWFYRLLKFLSLLQSVLNSVFISNH